MTGVQFSEGRSTVGSEIALGGSLSMSDVLSLPDDQRQLIIWMVRQGTVTLGEIAQHLDQLEAAAQDLIDRLVEQGYVQIVVTEAESAFDRQIAYRVQHLQYRPGSGNLDASHLLENNPLAVILSSAGSGIVIPGSQVELSVTVINKGNQSAIVDIFIDDIPPNLYQWCHSTQERLALGADQSGEVVFRFDIPATAIPEVYSYGLVVDAPIHYPNSPPLRYVQTIQVLPPLQNVVQVSDPTFVLQPVTSASTPAMLSPGEALEVQVVVYNRADRVDRFRLSCADLPKEWVSITYPQGFQQPGLAPEETYLDLNPNSEGTILLLILLPLDAPAGSYATTLRLRSENQPELAMLNLLYFNIRPIYQVDLSFRTLITHVRHQPGLFAIHATNQGNTARSLLLQVVALDDGKLCTYTLEPPYLQLAPKQTQVSQLWVQPQPAWKRPLFGGGRLLNFGVTVSDAEQHPLPDIPMQGYVVWVARPWWQLLPFVLLGIGAIATLIWLVWWLLLRPPVVPKIVRFATSDTQYSVAAQDAVQLDLQISHPQRVQAIEIVGQSPEGDVTSPPVTYDFSRGLPDTLQPICDWQRRLLTCRNLTTDARRAGDYQFTLTVIPKQGRRPVASDRLTAPPVTITPLPLPEILLFAPTQPTYPEAPPAQTADSETPVESSDRYGINLDWIIAAPEQLAALQITGRDAEGTVVLPTVELDFREGIPELLQPFCQLEEQLICENVTTGIRRAGVYTFEMTVIPTIDPPETPIAHVTDPINITPRPPQILSFQINGKPIQPKYILAIDQGQPIPEVVLSWEVEANAGTEAMILPVPGTVPLKGTLALPLSPEPGVSIVTLQVTNSAGAQVTQSFSIEVYDPTQEPPSIVINNEPPAEAGEPAASQSQETESPGAELVVPRPSQPDTLSPSELPPQFE